MKNFLKTCFKKLGIDNQSKKDPEKFKKKIKINSKMMPKNILSN